MELSGLQKVHIIPVGYEYERIIEPLKNISADKVYLVIGNKDFRGNAKYFYDKNRKEIEKKITRNIETVPCDIWNLTELLNKICTLIFNEKSKNNIVLINVSSGNKLFSVAATIAGMMYGAHLYYAKTKDQSQYQPIKKEKKGPEPFTKGPYVLEKIPHFTITSPKDDLIKALSIVEKKPRIKQYDFIVGLEKLGVLSNIYENETHISRRRKKQITKNIYGTFKRNIMIPLIEKKWIDVDGSGKKMRISISNEGKSTLRVFETIVLG